MKQACIIFISVLLLTSCRIEATPNEITRSDSSKVDPIARSFLDIVEGFRRYHRYELDSHRGDSDSLALMKRVSRNDYYDTVPWARNDPANVFEPYASRYSADLNRYVSSPNPTEDVLKVMIDTTVYNDDSSLFVSLVALELNYTEIAGYENKRHTNRRFDGHAIIGKKSQGGYDLYPLTAFKIIGYESKSSVIEELRQFYFFNLANVEGSAFTVFEGRKYQENLNSEVFFQNSPLFEEDSVGLYAFEKYVTGTEIDEFHYVQQY